MQTFISTVDSIYFPSPPDAKAVIFSMNNGEGISDCSVFDAVTAWDSRAKCKAFVVCIACSSVFEEDDLRENICSLFDLAENVLECKKILVFIEKYRTNLGELVRAFGYVGFSSAEYLCSGAAAGGTDDYCLLEVCL